MTTTQYLCLFSHLIGNQKQQKLCTSLSNYSFLISLSISTHIKKFKGHQVSWVSSRTFCCQTTLNLQYRNVSHSLWNKNELISYLSGSSCFLPVRDHIDIAFLSLNPWGVTTAGSCILQNVKYSYNTKQANMDFESAGNICVLLNYFSFV